jgi:hypothetical protein
LDAAATVADALQACCWEVERDENGEVGALVYEGKLLTTFKEGRLRSSDRSLALVGHESLEDPDEAVLAVVVRPNGLDELAPLRVEPITLVAAASIPERSSSVS